MKTRYEMLEKAGDLLDSAAKLMCDASESDLSVQTRVLLARLYKAQEEAWDERYAEPELEQAS
jgi:hypothetical protein